MKYLLVNNSGTIVAISDQEIKSKKQSVVAIDIGKDWPLLGQKAVKKKGNKIRLAVICNWRQPCGISTYTQYLIERLRKMPALESLRIFSEVEGDRSHDQEENVVRCWQRGESMKQMIRELPCCKRLLPNCWLK